MPTCTDAPVESAMLGSGCISIDTGGYFSIETVASGGACTPSGGAAQLPEARFVTQTLGCGAERLSTSGCPTGSVCAPDPTNGFLARRCIAREGDVACPGPPYEERLVRYTDVSDDRACGSCACGAPTRTCQGSVRASPLPTCSSLVPVMQLPSTTCGTMADTPFFRLTSLTGAGSCAPSPAVPSGGLADARPITLCCTR